MGILTYMSSTVDEDEGVQRIFAITQFAISNRASLNRIAGRATVETGVGQRTLVAAAYDDVGIDLVWREGPFRVMSPEEKWPDAQDITFYSVPVERSSEFFDITDMPKDAIPTGKIADQLLEGIDTLRPEQVMYVWEIPFEVGGRKI